MFTRGEEPYIIVEELATNGINLKTFFWTTTIDYRKGVLLLRSEMIKRAKNALQLTDLISRLMYMN